MDDSIRRYNEIRLAHERAAEIPETAETTQHQERGELLDMIAEKDSVIESFQRFQKLPEQAHIVEQGIGEILLNFRSVTGMRGYPDVKYDAQGHVHVTLKVCP